MRLATPRYNEPMSGRDEEMRTNPGVPPHGASVRRGDPVKLTYDDFLLFPDDGKRHESIFKD
jgi:hypothetical protein